MPLFRHLERKVNIMKNDIFKVGDRVKILDKEGAWADKFRPYLKIMKVETNGICSGLSDYYYVNPRTDKRGHFNNIGIFEKVTPKSWKDRLQ